jgi:hypothetical protein
MGREARAFAGRGQLTCQENLRQSFARGLDEIDSTGASSAPGCAFQGRSHPFVEAGAGALGGGRYGPMQRGLDPNHKLARTGLFRLFFTLAA